MKENKIKNAYEILTSYSPDPGNSALCNNNVSEHPGYDLQIIIPAYNSEKYLKACLDSVIGQKTRFSYKVVVINDGSTDSTPTILKEYEKFDFIEIITQENKGFSGARNAGLKNIDAKYIMFVDSDDLLCDNAVESLLSAAKDGEFQIVEGGHYRFSDADNKKEKITREACEGDKSIGISGYTCMKIYHSELFRNVCLPQGYLFEDTAIRYLIASRSNKNKIISDIVYGYRQHETSITGTFYTKPKSVDCLWVMIQLTKDAFEAGVEDKQFLYEATLKQIWSNYGRTGNAPKEVKKAIFTLSVGLVEKYFNSFSTKNVSLKPLEIALKARSFLLYKIYCIVVSKYLER